MIMEFTVYIALAISAIIAIYHFKDDSLPEFLRNKYENSHIGMGILGFVVIFITESIGVGTIGWIIGWILMIPIFSWCAYIMYLLLGLFSFAILDVIRATIECFKNILRLN